MGRNIVEKIWEKHLVLEKPGHPAVFAIDLMLLHEVTSAQAFRMLEERGLPLATSTTFVATLDHSIPTRKNRFEIFDEAARNQVEMLRRNCRKWGIPLFDFDSGSQGIVHVIGPELGLTHPGMTVVCGDSHTSTHGAFGALAFGIGTSEVGHVLASGRILQRKPRTMKVEFQGALPKGVYAKDMILRLIAEIGVGGGTGYVLEYCGEAIRSMSMEGRMTICNMSIECGARAGLISPDETTTAFLKGRQFAPTDDWGVVEQYWRSFASDPDATFDSSITIDVSKLEPMVTWGTNPGQAMSIECEVPDFSNESDEARAAAEKALAYTKIAPGKRLAGTPVQWAFLGSCTNGRIEDLRVAARILAGRRIHQSVTMYVVPGSEAVRAQAEREGLDRIFTEAGAQFRMPGCSMCLGMNDDLVPAGERCISTSNRNFVGRQGPGSLTHLASPATVAASAIAGCITSPLEYLR